MKTREEVARYINSGANMVLAEHRLGAAMGWHYGKTHLRGLLDFIYGGPPGEGETIERLDPPSIHYRSVDAIKKQLDNFIKEYGTSEKYT